MGEGGGARGREGGGEGRGREGTHLLKASPTVPPCKRSIEMYSASFVMICWWYCTIFGCASPECILASSSAVFRVSLVRITTLIACVSQALSVNLHPDHEIKLSPCCCTIVTMHDMWENPHGHVKGPSFAIHDR